MIKWLKNFFDKLFGRKLELVKKIEEPNIPTIEEYDIPDDILRILKETEERYSGTMSLRKDILAYKYVKKYNYSYVKVAVIFNVDESTIRRRVKDLDWKFNVIFHEIWYETCKHTTDEIIKYMNSYYGEYFSLDYAGNLKFTV